MDQSRKYFWNVLVLFGAALCLSALLNIVVDPDDQFGFKPINNFNHRKYQANGDCRIVSAHLMRGNYDTLIIGSSTTRYLDPEHPALKGDRVFKYIIMGTNFYEMYKIYEYTRKYQKLSKMLIGLDFYAFADNKTVEGDFDDSFFTGKDRRVLLLRYLLSYTTLQYSFKTVYQSLQSWGDYAPPRPEAALPGDDKPLDHRFLFTQVLLQDILIRPFEYPSDSRMALLKQMAEQCNRDNTRLYLYVSPLHARHMEMIRVLGLWTVYEDWLRNLTTTVDQANKAVPGGPAIELFDFSGYNSITTEDLPALGEKNPRMKYWGESVHFKKNVARMIMDAILHYPNPDLPRPPDFGIILTPQNIDAYIENLRQTQKQYEQEHFQDVKEIEKLAIDTRRLRKPGYPLVMLNGR